MENVVPQNASDAEDKRAEGNRLLFVNPSRNKGVFLFARIATELQRLRPDIPILVVEGSDGAKELRDIAKGWSDARNIEFMKNTTRPANFFRYAKATLVPSFFDESFGRVAAESLIAGKPVVASNRGALPETLATPRFCSTSRSATLPNRASSLRPKRRDRRSTR